MGDASTSFGVGVVVGKYWAACKWAPNVAIGPGKEFGIGWGEAVAVELGLRMVLHHGLASFGAPAGANLLVRSDNAGIVAVVNKGHLRSENTNLVLKEMHILLAHNGMSLTAQHVLSEDNIADKLSRGDFTAFKGRFPTATDHLSFQLPPHLTNKLILL